MKIKREYKKLLLRINTDRLNIRNNLHSLRVSFFSSTRLTWSNCLTRLNHIFKEMHWPDFDQLLTRSAKYAFLFMTRLTRSTRYAGHGISFSGHALGQPWPDLDQLDQAIQPGWPGHDLVNLVNKKKCLDQQILLTRSTWLTKRKTP